MPLRRVTKFCSATCKASGQPCKNPAAYQMATCKSHGARPQATVLRGQQHPNYKHGLKTLEAQTAYRVANAKLVEIEALGFSQGFMTGLRTRGPKPKLKSGADQ